MSRPDHNHMSMMKTSKTELPFKNGYFTSRYSTGIPAVHDTLGSFIGIPAEADYDDRVFSSQSRGPTFEYQPKYESMFFMRGKDGSLLATISNEIFDVLTVTYGAYPTTLIGKLIALAHGSISLGSESDIYFQLMAEVEKYLGDNDLIVQSFENRISNSNVTYFKKYCIATIEEGSDIAEVCEYRKKMDVFAKRFTQFDGVKELLVQVGMINTDQEVIAATELAIIRTLLVRLSVPRIFQ